MIDCYSVLGIGENSSLTEIKNAYRKLSKKFHPDVNQGDKYFEERFKEIQNAYEILSDSNKRAKYDAERVIFKGNNGRRTRDEYSNEEYIKRQKEEIKRREEELRRKEEEFRCREQTNSKREEKTDSKRIHNSLAYLLFIPLIIILIVVISKSGSSRIQNYPDKNTVVLEESDNSLTPGLNPPSNQPSELDLEKIKDSDILNNLIKGHWEGTAYQSNINESWAIKLVFDKEADEFNVAYPSLNCTGYWKVKSMTNYAIEFVEILKTGQNICNDGGKIVLKQLHNDQMEFFYYWPSETRLDSKGEIERVK